MARIDQEQDPIANGRGRMGLVKLSSVDQPTGAVAEFPADAAASRISQRLLSLDALRGFDMMWIMGGKEIIQASANLTDWAALTWMAGQLEHPEWHGFAFYDLIFPLFLFMAGVSIPYSFENRIAAGDTKQDLYVHVFVRGALLVFLGLIYNGLLKFDWSTMRYPSVLGRIGLAYSFAALIALNTGVKARLGWFAALLLAYWAALRWVPVPVFGAGDLSPGHTLTDFIDRTLLPGRLYRGDRDPVGLLGTVPAISTALAGILAGDFLKRSIRGGYAKTARLAVAGVLCLVLALLWNEYFPINKNLWSSSFVLCCAGWSLLLLASFYLVIDVWRIRRWTFVFVVIGSNSILIYMAQQFIDFGYTTRFFFGGALSSTGRLEPLLWAICLFFVKWLMLLLFYRKKIFLKV
jgi:predicted acyltransferase